MEFSIKSQTFTSFAPALPTPTPTNPVPPAQLWSIGQGPNGDIYYTEAAFSTIGEVNSAGAQNCIQNTPYSMGPNLTSALVAPDDTTGNFIFVTISAGVLVAVNDGNLTGPITVDALPTVTVTRAT